jgi:hypothetical protein
MNLVFFPNENEGSNMGEKGKKDKARREVPKKSKLTIKEKRKKKKEKRKELLERA